MRPYAALLALSCFAAPASAQDRPSLKLPLTVIAVGGIADNLTTNWPMQPVTANGRIYSRAEVNPLLPDHRGKNAAVQAGITAGVLLAVHRFGPDHPKLAKALAWTLGAVNAADTIQNLAVRNRINGRKP